MNEIERLKDEIKTRKMCTMDEHMGFYNQEAESDYKLFDRIEKVLDSLAHPDDVDWEQRRYEIAKDVFPFVSKLTTDILVAGQKVEGSAGKTVMQVCAEKTLLFADALIEELKKR